MTEHAPAVFALALAFFLGGGARDVGPLVCPPACAYLSACQSASCPPPRLRPTLPCPDRYIDFSIPPAPQDGPPVPSSCLTPPARFALPSCAARLPVAFSCLTARLSSPHALPCHRYLASAAGRAPPPARHGRPARLVCLLHACTACGLLGAPPAAYLPLLTSCTFSRASHPAALGRKQ